MSIQRSEIYFVNLNPVQGREQAGQRPVLVLSINAINRLPLVITVVVGTKGSNITKDHATNVRVSPEESGLPLETVFLGFQVRSLDASRFPDQPAGELSDEKMIEVENAARYCLGL
ncbi:MAG: type II toxin-antitoxin system PemK/MazF family toxin [Phormidesmis sp. CAN_BIN44]|nr:type II toxin-antitoxin system PemK/MazF family toxin [Phormidesmis sp. CAN_BIN44]